ncbi:MAG TPA: deoxyribodipyrimidine photo-lyase, partial [Tianweitania sediminis]|nr:deoxyribodipyrimidine photo-lyase [Tianweitania sediminis]
MSAKQASKPTIVLFRDDLRVADNHALYAAHETGKPIIPVFILDHHPQHGRGPGGARLWWLHHSVAELSDRLDGLGAPLLLRRGRQNDVVRQLVGESGASAVYWNRRYDPANEADAELKRVLGENGIEAKSFEGALLHEPTQLTTGAGTPYKVFGAFWRALNNSLHPRDPMPAPKKLAGFNDRKLQSDTLADWKLLPTNPDWSTGFDEFCKPGETAAHEALHDFVRARLQDYGEARNFPGRKGSSQLSAYLAHGELTPFQVHQVVNANHAGDGQGFLREIGWREFNYHLLFHKPDLHLSNVDKSFDAFPWQSAPDALKAWQRGRTGYPIVDAGMRQLWQTGWMHNRVRLITGSFLVKHLLIDWREGERWFWDTLVDADPANNPANWQWIAGSGADAAPFFRIFNPILQG